MKAKMKRIDQEHCKKCMCVFVESFEKDCSNQRTDTDRRLVDNGYIRISGQLDLCEMSGIITEEEYKELMSRVDKAYFAYFEEDL